jgi:hypothetical protein
MRETEYRKRKTADHVASMEDVDQFMQSFTPPARIPTLRKKDIWHLEIWYGAKRWRVEHPGEYRPCTISI